jgi:hypothetical protein
MSFPPLGKRRNAYRVTAQLGTWLAAVLPSRRMGARAIPLKVEQLDLVSARAEAVMHQGRAAIRLTEDPALPPKPDTEFLAILQGTEFSEGTIELSVAGAPQLDASSGARGFIGIIRGKRRGWRAAAPSARPRWCAGFLSNRMRRRNVSTTRSRRAAGPEA